MSVTRHVSVHLSFAIHRNQDIPVRHPLCIEFTFMFVNEQICQIGATKSRNRKPYIEQSSLTKVLWDMRHRLVPKTDYKINLRDEQFSKTVVPYRFRFRVETILVFLKNRTLRVFRESRMMTSNKKKYPAAKIYTIFITFVIKSRRTNRKMQIDCKKVLFYFNVIQSYTIDIVWIFVFICGYFFTTSLLKSGFEKPCL